MKHAAHIALLVLAAHAGMAQERSFRATVNRESILLGEQLNLALELRTPAADSASLPLFGDTLINAIEIISASKPDTTFEGSNLGQRVLRQTLRLTSFDSGYYAIAPLVALVNGDTLLSNAFLIAVHTPEVDTAKGFYDIRDIAEAPFSLTEWLNEYWPWIAIPLALLAIITYVMLWWSKRPVTEITVPPAPTRSAHEIALERLDELEQKKLWQAAKTKEYYIELTDILREYLCGRFGIPAPEQTTDECVASLRRLPEITPTLLEHCKRLLFLADLVKFAKENPIGQENEMHLQNIRAFVNSTSTPITTEQPANV